MKLFQGGKLDSRLAAKYFEALEAEFRTRDMHWLAAMLAVEIVDREIERQMREEYDARTDEIMKSGRASVEKTLRAALRQLDERREDWLQGIAFGRSQRARRLDRPAVDPYRDPSRNDRIRAFHARLKADNAPDATARTAEEFGLSDRQIRSIVKK